jgi:hypothetical protein
LHAGLESGEQRLQQLEILPRRQVRSSTYNTMEATQQDAEQQLPEAVGIPKCASPTAEAASNLQPHNTGRKLLLSGPERDEQFERLQKEFAATAGDSSAESALRENRELDARTSYAESIIQAAYKRTGLPKWEVVDLPVQLDQCVHIPVARQQQVLEGVRMLTDLNHYTEDRQYTSALGRSGFTGVDLSEQEGSLHHVLMVRTVRPLVIPRNWNFRVTSDRKKR